MITINEKENPREEVIPLYLRHYPQMVIEMVINIWPGKLIKAMLGMEINPPIIVVNENSLLIFLLFVRNLKELPMMVLRGLV